MSHYEMRKDLGLDIWIHSFSLQSEVFFRSHANEAISSSKGLNDCNGLNSQSKFFKKMARVGTWLELVL